MHRAMQEDIARHTLQVCPCCGGQVQQREIIWNEDLRTLAGNGQIVSFTPAETEIVVVLLQLRNRVRLSLQQLAARVYAHRLDGGPDCASTPSVHMMKIRKKFALVGLQFDGANESNSRKHNYQKIMVTGDLVTVPREAR